MYKNKRIVFPISNISYSSSMQNYIMLTGITFLGFGLRYYNLTGDLYSDEVWIIKTAASPYPDFVREIMEDWVHPPLFHFLARAWIVLFGLKDISGRLISITFGVLSIHLIYWIGKEILGSKTGLVAAALLALSPTHIYHSQYGRHYSLFVFFVLLSMASYIKIYHQPSNLKYGVIYILSNILLVYTHYYGWLIVLCESLSLIVFKIKYFKYWAILQIIIILSYMPWIYLVLEVVPKISSKQLLVPHIGWIKPISLIEPINTLAIFNGEISFPYQKLLGNLLLGGIAIISLKNIFRNDKRKEEVIFLFSCVFVPFLLVFVISYFVQPIWILRAMLLSLPPYYLLISIGNQQVTSRKVSFFLMIIPLLWMSIASMSYIRSEHRMPYERIANYLERESVNGIPILVENTYLMNSLFHYYRGDGILYELKENNTSIVPANHKGNLGTVVSAKKATVERFILVTYMYSTEKEIHEKLSFAYKRIKKDNYFGYGEENNRRIVSISFYEKN